MLSVGVDHDDNIFALEQEDLDEVLLEDSIIDREQQKILLKLLVLALVELDPRYRKVIACRCGLLTGRPLTLKETALVVRSESDPTITPNGVNYREGRALNDLHRFFLRAGIER